jgi:hypothetical protein
MLAAFVHFSPEDENSKLKSGNWLINNITIDNVDRVYVYNYLNGLWQTGQPATSVRFEGVRATGILNAFTIIGDTADQFNMSIQNSSFKFKEGTAFNSDSFEGAKNLSKAFFNIKNFDKIVLNKVTVQKSGSDPVLQITSGNSLTLERINFITDSNATPYLFQNISEIKKGNINLGYTSRSK